MLKNNNTNTGNGDCNSAVDNGSDCDAARSLLQQCALLDLCAVGSVSVCVCVRMCV